MPASVTQLVDGRSRSTIRSCLREVLAGRRVGRYLALSAASVGGVRQLPAIRRCRQEVLVCPAVTHHPALSAGSVGTGTENVVPSSYAIVPVCHSRGAPTASSLGMDSSPAVTRLRDCSSCPRCDSRHVIRWGRSATSPRFRCRGCGQTFSPSTATPLAYLKKRDRWAAFCACVNGTMTVRRAAVHIGVHRDTAFRWRHRLLDALRAGEYHLSDAPSPALRALRGRILVGEAWFMFSEKGSRNLDRPARRHGYVTDWLNAPRAWVVVGRHEGGRSVHALVGRRRPNAADVAHALEPVAGPDVTLVSRFGPFGAVAGAARRLGVVHEHGWSLPSKERIEDDIVQLRRWLRRFCGVATRYLPNYLTWYRLLHPGEPALAAPPAGRR
jgi:transposase-like protein